MLKAHGGSTEGSGLGDVFNSLVQHLTTTHFVFLQKWDRLIDLEAKELEVKIYFEIHKVQVDNKFGQ